MADFGVSQEVVEESALACARILAEAFGSVEDAIAAIESDPVAMAQIAITEHSKRIKAMSVSAHMNISRFSAQVFHAIKESA